MKSRIFAKIIGALIIFSAICALAAWYAPTGESSSRDGNWLSIVPPVLAILLAFITRHVLFSLGAAVVVGGLLTQVQNLPITPNTCFDGFKTAGIYIVDALASTENLQILAFVGLIFAMIEILIASGGFNGVIRLLVKCIKGRKSAEAVTALLGVGYFFDDYSNTIIVGSAMRPITDRFGVSREKLAFLVDATSAPITGLAFISTWIAYEVGLFESVGGELGIEKSGYSMFFDALGFRFYCVLMIVFVFVHIIIGRDFGPMKAAEEKTKGKDLSQQNNSKPSENVTDSAPTTEYQRPGRAINALVPLAGLIIFHITALWFSGGGADRLKQGQSLMNWAYWRQTISNVGNSYLLLVYSSIFGLILAVLCARFSEGLKLPEIAKAFFKGVKKSLLPCVILVLAWSLKNCCDSLKTGGFLSAILAGSVSPYWFPPLLFIAASVTSFATGTSWGTMAILIPTAVPVAFALDGQTYGLTTMISLGAVLDGAIFGDHCSPISDTTIISSMASRCDLIQHVRTQLPYSLFVAALALLCGYLPAALGMKWIWSVGLAALIMVSFFLALSIADRKNLPTNNTP